MTYNLVCNSCLKYSYSPFRSYIPFLYLYCYWGNIQWPAENKQPHCRENPQISMEDCPHRQIMGGGSAMGTRISLQQRLPMAQSRDRLKHQVRSQQVCLSSLYALGAYTFPCMKSYGIGLHKRRMLTATAYRGLSCKNASPQPPTAPPSHRNASHTPSSLTPSNPPSLPLLAMRTSSSPPPQSPLPPSSPIVPYFSPSCSSP